MRGGRWGGGADICLSLSLLPGPVSQECQQMLFEYLQSPKICCLLLIVILSAGSGLTLASISRTLPLLVINDHWICWHSLTLGSIFVIVFFYSLQFSFLLQVLVDSSVQESLGPASVKISLSGGSQEGRSWALRRVGGERAMTPILASDWSILITWPVHWPLIGWADSGQYWPLTSGALQSHLGQQSLG